MALLPLGECIISAPHQGQVGTVPTSISSPFLPCRCQVAMETQVPLGVNFILINVYVTLNSLYQRPNQIVYKCKYFLKPSVDRINSGTDTTLEQISKLKNYSRLHVFSLNTIVFFSIFFHLLLLIILYINFPCSNECMIFFSWLDPN